MRLPFQHSKDPAPERRPRSAMADDTAAVEAARTRARRRLIGAGVLLVAGLIGFPMLFETQPRPLPADTPIQVRPRDIALAPEPASAPAPKPPALPAPPDVGTDVPDPVRSGETGAVADAPADASPPVPAATPAAPAPAPAEPSPPGPAVALPVTPAPRPDDGARARALLEGRAPATAAAAAATTSAASATARFVVQAGAYGDAATLRSARQRVERLGLKTYIQVVDTADGKRTRVRVGPYASRDEADAAAARIKGAGLPAAVLVL